MKNKSTPKTVSASDFFTPKEQKSITHQDLEGKILILNPNRVSGGYRNRPNLLWIARGGFGCSPDCAGRAVFAQCLANQEQARWDRHDFVAEFQGHLPPLPTVVMARIVADESV